MSSSLIATGAIEINATSAQVWEVLVKPKYIRQWDDIPEGFSESQLNLGSELIWEHGDDTGAVTRLTVTDYITEQLLKMRWFSSPVVESEAAEIYYAFSISNKNGITQLRIDVGDWSLIPNSQDYYDASVEFVESATKTIKNLAGQQ